MALPAAIEGRSQTRRLGEAEVIGQRLYQKSGGERQEFAGCWGMTEALSKPTSGAKAHSLGGWGGTTEVVPFRV